MRIALVCVSLRGGGTERIVTRIANNLVEAHKVAVITLSPVVPFYPLHEKVSVQQPDFVSGSVAKPLRLFRQIKHLYAAVRAYRSDLALIFGEDISGVGSLVARSAGTAKVWNFFRGSPDRATKGFKGVLNRLFCRLSDRIFVQTQEGKSVLSGPFSAGKLTFWPNPIEIPDSVRPPGQRERLIVNVGSIGRLKNQAALLRIFRGLTNAPEWKLAFIGDGPDRKELETLAFRSEMADAIAFVGEQEDISPYLDKASVFAFTSLSEGFPNALAEAMAAGCACISFDCQTGPSALIEHGVNGFLVKPGDESEYAQLLQKLIDNAELRVRFSHNARQSMKPFEASVVMMRLEEMIEEVLGKESAKRPKDKRANG